METALQLYTVREYTKNRDQLAETFAKVKAAGYGFVEPAGYCGLSPEEFGALLAENGLRAVSTHTGHEALASKLAGTIAAHKAIGASHLSVPGMPGSSYRMTPVGYSAFGERLEAYAQELAKEGISLSYHNHGHEFILRGEMCGERYILGNAPSLNLQLDVGHCYAAGENPAEWIRRYSGRVKTVHYKDVSFENGKRRDMPIGEGEVDWAAVTAAVLKTGCEYIIVEHEEFIRDPWDVLETSYKNIEKMLGR